MAHSKEGTNDKWNMVLNTENPIAPQKIKKRHIKEKNFAKNFDVRTKFGHMNLWHITPPSVKDVHNIKKRLIGGFYKNTQ
jgi:hypothetical protein